MLSYFEAIQTAVLIFPLVGLVLFVPLYIAHHRRFGEVHEYRAFVSFLFAFSIIAAMFLTILPLPPETQVACEWRTHIEFNQFMPGASFMDIVYYKRHHDLTWDWQGLVANKALWQIALNTLMLLPFGFLMRALYGTRAMKCVVYAFVLSLCLETSQMTALWGLAKCPYRLFDVDDLLTNTLGALIGWVLYGAFRWLPDPKVSEDDLWYRKSIGRDDNDPGFEG